MSSKLTGYPRHNPLKGKTKKPPEFGGFVGIFDRWRLSPLQPLRAATVPPVPARSAIAIVAIPVKAATPVAVSVATIDAPVPPAALPLKGGDDRPACGSRRTNYKRGSLKHRRYPIYLSRSC